MLYIEIAEDEDGETLFYIAESPGVWVGGPYTRREAAEERLETLQNSV